MQQKPLTMAVRLSLLVVALGVIGLDQLTKYIVRANLSLYQVKPFIAHWNWVLAYNEGSAFGFLADQGGWQKLMFGVIAAVVAISLTFYLLKKNYHLIAGIAFSFILGGAVGNLLDRIMAGKVTDFIDWYIADHHWPFFNVADSFISVGVALLIIESLFFSKNSA
jgi:signal peptidase II